VLFNTQTFPTIHWSIGHKPRNVSIHVKLPKAVISTDSEESREAGVPATRGFRVVGWEAGA
jgi:hypothetical protein